jgi:hypothetical protein
MTSFLYEEAAEGLKNKTQKKKLTDPTDWKPMTSCGKGS